MSNTRNAPTCKRCGGTGTGVQFPLFPRAKGFSFGDLCVDCDDKMVESELKLVSPTI